MSLTSRQITDFGKALVFLLLLSITLSSCRKNSSSLPSQPTIREKAAAPVDFDFDKISERGVLRVVLDNSSTGYFIYKGQTMGYEYDLLYRWASDVGLRLEIKLTADMEEAFAMLDRGDADVMAYHLTVTKERSEKVAFTDPHNEVRQVLIQRMPAKWQSLKKHEIEAALIRNPLELTGKEIYIRKGSAFSSRLKNLSDEIGGDILVVEEQGKIDTETLIKKVADGEIDYTVADSDVGLINATYYPNIDAKTEISFPQKIAWAVRKNAPVLQDTINYWLKGIKNTPDFNVIYNRYFKYAKSQYLRTHSDYSSVQGGKISPYDELLKSSAEELDIDWILLSSLVYQESKFDPSVESWAGAKGLMQLTESSIERYGVGDPYDANENIRAGTQFIRYLEEFWKERVPDHEERLNFVLASYNVGHGHVLDAVRLARKYDGDESSWESVSGFLIEKSKSQYYNDPVVKYGYCRGNEPVNYVTEILDRYEQYKLLFDDSEAEKSEPN